MPRARVSSTDSAKCPAACARPRVSIKRLILTAGAILGLSCEGEIGNGTDRPVTVAAPRPGLGTGVPGIGTGAAGSGVSAAVSATDNAMRAQNPGLFDVAVRYFPGGVAQGGPKRLFRLTRTQLDTTTKTLLPAQYKSTVVQTFPRDPLQTNYEYSDNLSFNAANFTPYTDWVGQIVSAVKANPASIIDCAATNNAPACLDQQARGFVQKAFRGVAPEAQLVRFSTFFTASVKEVGIATATADLVDVTLTSPAYVFREEVQTDSSHALFPAQQLQNISYTLADAPPETFGMSSASAAAQLSTPAAVQNTLDKVLATKEARDKLMRFFMAWLEVREPDEFTIAPDVFPEFTPALATAMIEETRAFLTQRLSAAAPKLKDVTQSTESFVSDALASIYGIRSPSKSGGLVTLDANQRLGILTQPAVIASHSGPTTTRLVKRGVFFTRKVMCLPLGLPPPGVNTTLPMTANATERQRVESVTNNPTCLGCHAFINPFGFMQENYDAIGRWRTTDQGLPIDASISVDFLDEGTLTTRSPVDALKGLTNSMRFQQCFAKQLFRFYMGRDEAAGDDPILRQIFFGFANKSEQDILGMLRTLASSSSFLQRSEAL